MEKLKKKFSKKFLILMLCIIAIFFTFLYFGMGGKRTDVVLSDYEILQDGNVLKFKVNVSSSMGYIKDFRVKQESENLYLTFYSTFGLNNKWNAKNEFELELNSSCKEIYFDSGDDKYNLVLQKTSQNDWAKPVEREKENPTGDNSVSEISEEEKLCSFQKGSRFAKWGNNAVYMNDFDETIYQFNLSTKESKKLYKPEKGANTLYFDGEFVYFMPYYYRGKGIYKLDLEGNVTQIYNGASLRLWLTENEIYFIDQIGFDDINQTPQGNLCKMNKDGSNKEIIIENVKNTFYLVDNFIYYTDLNTRSIYRAKMDGTEKTEMAKGRTYLTSATNQYITYIDYNDGEKQRILYLDNHQNDAVGRFGNVFDSLYGTYFYTRKLLDNQNNLEDENTLFSVDLHNHAELECWKADQISLDTLSYVWKDNAYFRGNGYYRINIHDKNEKETLDFGSGYFIAGKFYGFKSQDGILTEMYWYDLDNMKKEIISVKEEAR